MPTTLFCGEFRVVATHGLAQFTKYQETVPLWRGIARFARKDGWTERRYSA
jgi:hypothetical protein